MATTYPILRWKIGNVTISRVVEIEGSSPGTFFFKQATPERLLQHAWLKPHFLTEEGRIIASIHCFVIQSEGRTIVVDTCVDIITGDLMHHPVQCAEPGWAANFDIDPDTARRTRRAFLERHAGRPVLVLGTHFATPTAGRIVRDGNAFHFKP